MPPSRPQIITQKHRSPETKLNILIIGAGLGGLGAAISLLLTGHNVHILESTASLTEIGAGIQCLPNCTRILFAWGLESRLQKVAMAPRKCNMRGWKGELISDMDFREEILLGREDPPLLTGDLAYRLLLDTKQMLEDPDLRGFVEDPQVNYWIGPDAHAVTYVLRNGKLFNMVLLVPDDMPAGATTLAGNVSEMRALYRNWDPRIPKLLALCKQVSKWRLTIRPSLDPSWSHHSAALTVLGDAAHATLPYLASGAGMSIEDGHVLGLCLDAVTRKSTSEKGKALAVYERCRRERTERVVARDEVTYQDMRYLQKIRQLPASMRQNLDFMAALGIAASIKFNQEGTVDIEARAGYQKIVKTAEITRSKGYDWFWIDTCCIDKSSSAELQEAINSMYAWYKRGWTLQELIAPRFLEFYDDTWNNLCVKTDVLKYLSRATNIPENVLATGDLESTSVAQKMSWAANRHTTRLEDEAYALLGIFDIQMPMLYGEGDKAFSRLQEQIVRTTADDSIFSWSAVETQATTYRGVFARSPREFANCTYVGKGESMHELSTLGLRITLQLKQIKLPRIRDTFEARLNAVNQGFDDSEREIRMTLRELPLQNPATPRRDITEFARIFPQLDSIDMPEVGPEFECTVCMVTKPQPGPGMTINAYHCFNFKSSILEDMREFRLPGYTVNIVDAHPKRLWVDEDHTLLVPQQARDFVGVVRVSLSKETREKAKLLSYWAFDYHILVGLSELENDAKQAWLKVLPLGVLDDSLELETSESLVKKSAGHEVYIFDSDKSHATFFPVAGMTHEMHYGLVGDEMSIIIKIPGLVGSRYPRHQVGDS
ncbi:hypothetical protein E8E13_003353 [Curvularia kusanoi]|uniref:Heterokaryon incompatibility domain-containing protein n=1 Tax=Curvularia kusanoi TaxID=90978 RepID=A0A9P4WAT8_CURKU|nr:hypothetical protein E8E13_003353 [Curvularia kusanoi]